MYSYSLILCLVFQNVVGTGKRVVAGDAEYFEAIHEKEPVVVDTDIFYE